MMEDQINANTKNIRPRQNAAVVTALLIIDIYTSEDNKRDIFQYLTKWGEYVRNPGHVDELVKNLSYA